MPSAATAPAPAGLNLDRLRVHIGGGGVVAQRWGERVRNRRLALQLSQQQLADLIGDGITVQTISKIERGEIAPRDYLRAALALRLAQEIEELFPWPKRAELQRAAA